MTAGPFTLIAASLASREAYELVAAAPHKFEAPLDSIWYALVEFYDRDPEAAEAGLDSVVAFATRGLSNPKHVATIRETVENMVGTPVSTANVVAMLREAAQEDIAHRLATAVSARRPAEEVQALIDAYQRACAPPEAAEDRELAWEGIVSRRLTSAPRLKVFRALNERLGGGLLPGHNVTIFGLVESGKSALALTLATGFAKQGRRVLYVANEDPAPDLMVRAIQMAARKSRQDLAARPEEAERAALAAGVGNLYIRDLAPGTLGEIERLVRKHEPAVLVVDQIRNILATKQDNYTQRLDAVAQGIRAIGKRHGLVTIGVTQAADSARGRAVLDAGDVDSSNVGIPGAADVLIGIGSTDQLQSAGLRTLSLAKNKVAFTHGSLTVRVCPTTGRLMSHEGG